MAYTRSDAVATKVADRSLLYLAVLWLITASGCSADAGPQQTGSKLAEIGRTQTRPTEKGEGKAAQTADPRGRLPLPVRSATCPIRASDLFPPAEIAGLRYDVRIKGDLPLLRQDKTKACWAAASTMLAGWKNGRKVAPFDYLASLGNLYSSMYTNNTGLRREEKEAFLKRAGLTFEWGASYHPDGVETLLKKYGPLWFTISNGTEFSQHATVIVGLFGTGDMKNTYIVYADPADGKEHALLYPDYMKVYEGVAFDQNSLKDFEEGFQVVHYP